VSVVDIVSSLRASLFPQIGLVFFLAAFAAVCFRLFWRGRRLDDIARLPLTEAPVVSGRAGAQHADKEQRR